MTVRVLALSSGTTGLEDHRHAIAALITPAGVLQTRGGVFAAVGGAADLVPVAAMQAKVTAHYAWIDGGAALEAGYDFTSDSDVLLTFDPGEPGVTRFDRVIDRVRNNPYDSSGSVVGSVEILKGKPSGAATDLPPNCELLWEVPVPAGASAGTGGLDFNAIKIEKRRYTATIGGMVPVKDQAERDAFVSPYVGLPIWRRDRAWKEVHVGGGAWRVQGVATIASAADRAAITNPYDGQIIARTDRDWLEQYDGAKWRVQGTPVVVTFADLAAITDPYDGQGAYNLADKMLYRYTAAATAWRVVDYRVTQTLAASAPTLSFQGIPTYLRRLRLTWTARGDAAAVAQWLYMRINNDAIANYRWGYTQAAPAGVTPVQTMPDTRMVAGMLSGGNAFTGIFGSGTIDLEGWDSPHAGNLGMTHSGQVLQDGSNFFMVNGGGHYSPAGPYNRIDLTPGSGGNFVAGTSATLEGTP